MGPGSVRRARRREPVGDDRRGGRERAGGRSAGDPTTSLAGVAAVLDRCLLADLPAAVPVVLAALRDRAALDSDVEHLMEALPALARAVRYGDVRGTDASALGEVAESLLARVRAGLPAAVTGLGEDAAATLRQRLDEVDRATMLMAPSSRERWLASLTELARREDLHGLLAGRLVRLLHDARLLDDGAVARRLSQALSVGTTPAAKAAWVDGLLAGTAPCSSTTTPSSPSSTRGCAGSTRTTSPRCCRCCGAPSARSLPPRSGRSGRCWPG